jgi:hypothetical protein
MVGGSRMPGFGRVRDRLSPVEYIHEVVAGAIVDPVLTAHLHDGWQVAGPIRGYLPHDAESDG